MLPKVLDFLRKIPLVGWLCLAIVFLVWAGWSGWQRYWVAKRRLAVERKIAKAAAQWGQLEKDILFDNIKIERQISEERQASRDRLDAKSKALDARAVDIKSTADIVNEVFHR